MVNINTNYNVNNLPNIKNLPVIEVKSGQVFQGKILQVHPNNIAIVQLGDKLFPARLTAPLPIGETITMEVVEATNPITLKAISENMPNLQQNMEFSKSNVKPQLQNIDIKTILQNIGFKPTKENIQVAEQLAKYNLPMTRENVSLVLKLSANIDNIQETVEAMKIASNKNIPLTENTIKGVHTFVFGKGVHQSMKDVQSAINSLLSNNKNTFPSDIKPVMQNLAKILSEITKPDSNSSSAVRVNNNNNQESPISGLSINNKNIQPILSDKQLGSTQNNMTNIQSKPLLETQHQKVINPILPDNILEDKEGVIKQTVIQPIKNEVLPKVMDEKISIIQKQTIIANMEETVQPTLKSTTDFLKSLGILNEKDILHHFVKHSNSMPEHHTDNVKNLLLQILQQDKPEHPLPVSLVKSAESLLNHITGQQLFINTSDNATQNYTFQIPFQLLNENVSVFVQLEQKNDRNKKWDANNCSLFFYLTMEKMGETMISLQITNKVMSLSLYNDKPYVSQLIQKFKPSLEEKLKDKGYLLSSFKVLSKDDIPNKSQETTPMFQHIGKKYKGVDIRI